MKFNLKLYDQTLLTFEYVDTQESNAYCKIIYNDGTKTHLLPIGMELSDKGVYNWLKQRTIPKNREFVETILARMGLSRNDIMGIIKICKGLSLNDSYWVVEEGFEGKFEDYNLYQNKFKRMIGQIAFTGFGSMTARGFTSSPEFTTSGMLKKCWRRISGEIYLFKGGTMGGANTGNEPYSEYYASQIATAMEIDHIDYDLSKWKGTLSSTCKLFTDIDTAYVPIYKFVGENDSLAQIGDYLKNLGQEYYDKYIDMLIFDAVICNTDRHLGNFGLLVNSHTNQPIGFAPVFDNGMSLFNSAMDDDLKDVQKYAKTRIPALAKSHEYIVQTYATERQRAKLRKLLEFKFKKHSRYNLPNDRLKIIEKFIRERASAFLQMRGNN